MTSRRATKRRHQPGESRARRAAQRACHEFDNHGVMVGWCDGTPEGIEEAKRATHDGLIATMGSRRRGGVSWRIYEGADASAILDNLSRDAPGPEHSDYYRQIRAHLREWDGAVVLAHAPGVGEGDSQ